MTLSILRCSFVLVFFFVFCFLFLFFFFFFLFSPPLWRTHTMSTFEDP